MICRLEATGVFRARLAVRQIVVGEENMRSLTTYVVLLIFFATSGSLAQTQESADKTGASASASASKEEVNELRSEVAAQRKTIEELKAMVQKLAEDKSQAAGGSSARVAPVADISSPVEPTPTLGSDGARLVNTVLVQPEPAPEAAVVDQAQPAAAPR